MIAWELYFHLPRLSARFPHVLLFGGAAPRVAASAAFHPLFFPQVRQVRRFSPEDWPRRRFLVSITSNKAIVRSFTRWFDRPREVSIKRALASRRYPPIGRDLYHERLRAAAHFAGRADFDFFGQGWQRRHPAIPRRLHQAVMPAYRGPVGTKLETLSQYRFCLCFENSQFEGYISEKIFDCFFSRTIPIYLGAPDVARWIPPETFIDARAFASYRDLEAFLDGLDSAEQARYLAAAEEFVHSAAYQRFSAECFAQTVVQLLAASSGAGAG